LSSVFSLPSSAMFFFLAALSLDRLADVLDSKFATLIFGVLRKPGLKSNNEVRLPEPELIQFVQTEPVHVLTPYQPVVNRLLNQALQHTRLWGIGEDSYEQQIHGRLVANPCLFMEYRMVQTEVEVEVRFHSAC
jgi:hypothetical protein